MKPVINVPKSNRVYGVDTDAFNPDGVLVVGTIEELNRIPANRRTPNLRVKVNSTNKYYKVNPNNPEEFIETTLEEVKVSLDSTYSRTEIDTKLAEVNENIEKLKADGNYLTREVGDSIYASKAALNELRDKLNSQANSSAEPTVNLNDSEEFIALHNKVTTLEGEVARLRSALEAKADLATIPNMDTFTNDVLGAIFATPNLEKLTNTIVNAINKSNSNTNAEEAVQSTSSAEESSKPVVSDEVPSVSKEETPIETTTSNVTYWGIVPSDAPSADDIVALADKKEVQTLTDLEITFGNEDDEGYVVFAAPASLAGSLTFINRNNSFTQVPLKEGTVEINGLEYKYFIFEFSFELIPFKLR